MARRPARRRWVAVSRRRTGQFATSANRLLVVIDLCYVAPLEIIDALVPRHLAYPEKGHADGVFLLSGRMNPRTDGVILASDASREDVDGRAATDPFLTEKAARPTISEIRPSLSAEVNLGAL